MKAVRMTLEEAISYGMERPYALIRTLSSFSFGQTPAAPPSLEELVEAHFFSSEVEYRILHDGQGLVAFYLKEEPEEEYLEQSFKLANAKFGTRVMIRQPIEYDEDGQAVLRSGRLCGWEGSNKNE